jgi:hypothetical protein
MANQYDPEWDRVVRQLEVHFWRDHKTEFLELEEENKRLKLLAHGLQKEIEFMVLESRETHELEEK